MATSIATKHLFRVNKSHLNSLQRRCSSATAVDFEQVFSNIQQIITYIKSTIKTLHKGVKYVKVNNEDNIVNFGNI